MRSFPVVTLWGTNHNDFRRVSGAAGNIGVEAVVRAPADGYTLLQATMGSLTTNPHLYTDAKFKVERDLLPISMTFKVDHILIVNPRVPARNVAELVALATQLVRGLWPDQAGIRATAAG